MRDFNQEVHPEQVLKGTQGAQTVLKIPSGSSDNTSSPSSQPTKSYESIKSGPIMEKV